MPETPSLELLARTDVADDLSAPEGAPTVGDEQESSRLARAANLVAPLQGAIGEPWRSALIVGGVATVLRVALFLVSTNPLFMSDSGTYLDAAHRVHLPPDRPIGLSVMYAGVFEIAHDLRAVVVIQALLGIASAMLAVVVALQCGLRPRPGRLVGWAMACSPTALVFERLVLAETLAVFLSLLSGALFLSAIDHGLFGRAIAGGFVAGLIAIVRTNNALWLVTLAALVVAAGCALRTRTRLGLVCALIAGSAVAPLAYSTVYYVHSSSRDGQGTFGISQFEGISLFAKTARFTDCSEPDAPPAMRAEVCAVGDGYLDQSVNEIIWDGGPVTSALSDWDTARRNAELRELAFENIRNHPAAFFRLSLSTGWHNLTAPDGRYASTANDLDAPGYIVDHYFGADAAERESPRFSNALQVSYRSWSHVRPVIWLAAFGAIATAFTARSRRNRVGVLALGGFALPGIAAAMFGNPVARYVVPYEVIGFISLAWLAQVFVDRRRQRYAIDRDGERPSDTRTGDELIGATST